MNTHRIINIALIITCMLHVLSILLDYLYPENPSIKHYDRQLHEMDFPIIFKMCYHFPDSKFKDLGYKDSYEFIAGRSMFNKTLYGWGGHTINGSTLASPKGLFLKIK